MKHKRGPWSKYDKNLLLKLKELNCSIEKMAVTFNRTAESIELQLYRAKEPELREITSATKVMICADVYRNGIEHLKTTAVSLNRPLKQLLDVYSQCVETGEYKNIIKNLC